MYLQVQRMNIYFGMLQYLIILSSRHSLQLSEAANNSWKPLSQLDKFIWSGCLELQSINLCQIASGTKLKCRTWVLSCCLQNNKICCSNDIKYYKCDKNYSVSNSKLVIVKSRFYHANANLTFNYIIIFTAKICSKTKISFIIIIIIRPVVNTS